MAQFGRRRVVVTGVGMVSPLGLNARDSWANLLRGTSGLRSLDTAVVGTAATGPDAQLSSRVAGLVPNFNSASVPHADERRMARFTLFAVSAAQEALRNAGLTPFEPGLGGAYDPVRCGCSLGSGIGSLEDVTAAGDLLKTRGPGKLSPYFIPRILTNMAVCLSMLTSPLHTFLYAYTMPPSSKILSCNNIF